MLLMSTTAMLAEAASDIAYLLDGGQGHGKVRDEDGRSFSCTMKREGDPHYECMVRALLSNRTDDMVYERDDVARPQ